jgi:plastocyanin
MVSFMFIALAATNLLGITAAAPASQIRSTGVIHRIVAGSTTENGGLHFEPENVVAEVGDLVEFHFLPKNHSVVQSSFDKPCEPLANDKAVFSGFKFATMQGESKNVFTFQVSSKDPFWFYCSQTVGQHCQKGMSGVINQNFDAGKTLANYKLNSKNTVTKQPSEDPLKLQNGWIQPNMPF